MLSDANLKKFRQYIDELSSHVQNSKKVLSNAETLISKGIGSTFRTEYAKGKKATTNIQSIIDILQSLEGDLNKLTLDAKSYYNALNQASKK